MNERMNEWKAILEAVGLYRDTGGDVTADRALTSGRQWIMLSYYTIKVWLPHVKWEVAAV